MASHAHDHSAAFDVHGKDRSKVSRKLLISTAVTLAFVVIEIAGAVFANSLSLLGDALHNFTDSLALVLALMAFRLEKLPATPSKSFGYQRAGILAAFINAASLVAFTIYLLVEAWERFMEPQDVNTFWMIVTSIVALTMNIVIAWWLHDEQKEDLTVRSAVLHLMGDALSSVGIIIGAVVIGASGLVIIDPALSVLIAILIFWSSWGVLKEAVNILLEGAPAGVEPGEVASAIARMQGVRGVHHLHIWALSPYRSALSCHLMLGDVSLRSAGETLARVNEMLAARWKIAHTTIQVEYAECDPGDPWCVTAPAVSDEN